MKSILVPIDFSTCSAGAYRYALEIAAATKSEIQLLHVLYPNEGVDNNIYNAFWADDYMAERIKELKQWGRRNRKNPAAKKVVVQEKVMIGFPVSAVCDTAQDMGADLIVMGTTGATGLRGAFLGSIAAGVLSKTRIPVLAIPTKAKFLKDSDIVFATDYKFRVYEGSMDVLRNIFKFQGKKMQVVHILDKPGEKPDIERETNLHNKLKDFKCSFHYLHDKDVPQAIANFIESVGAGMLVSVAHDHSLLHKLFNDSVTRRLAHRSNVPLLVLHDTEA
ncbi:MAG: universal stress protein [Lewinellaceae bacterium]|nr:universal stress protein [Lewinellaceae bacterium]